MLQQTTVAAVIPYYHKWCRAYPSIRAVAGSSLERILKRWEGLGYYSRAKNIHKSARIICRDFGGKVPKNAEALRTLPGFGPYTVAAVLSIAFDQRTPLVDANVRRVIMRILALPGRATTQQDKKIISFLNTVLPSKKLGTFNQALMELGALVCRRKSPLCCKCPLSKFCRAFAVGRQENIPEVRVKKIHDVHAVVAVITHKKKFLIQKRTDRGLLAGLWEFPGGKIEPGETPRQAIKREVNEELGVVVEGVDHFMDVEHCYTQFRAFLSVWTCTLAGLPSPQKDRRWVSLAQFVRYAMPAGSVRIVERLRIDKIEKRKRRQRPVY